MRHYALGQMWVVNVNAGKTQLVLFDWSSNTGSIDLKMDGSIYEKKSPFRMLGLTLSSILDQGSCIIFIAKTASLRKLES